jgi:hypothetical protein
MRSKEAYFEERVSRLLNLAEAAQDAAERTPNDSLRATYARIAEHWLKLAHMAVGLGGLPESHVPGDADDLHENRAN